MKLLVFLLAALNICASGPVKDDTKKLYSMAIKSHVSKDSPDAPIYIVTDGDIELPTMIGRHPVLLIGDSASKFLGNESSIHGIRVNPITIDNGKIIITLSDYIIRKGEDGAKFSFSGSKEYVFSYIDSTKGYKLLQIKTHSF